MIDWLLSWGLSFADITALSAFLGLAIFGALFFAWISVRQNKQAEVDFRLSMVTGYQAVDSSLGPAESVFRNEKERNFIIKNMIEIIETRTILAGGRKIVVRVIFFTTIATSILTGLLSVQFGIGFLNGVGLFAVATTAASVAVIQYRANKAVKSFYKYFPDALEIISRGARAGIPVTEGIGTIGEEIPTPIGPAFMRASASLKIGVDLAPALREIIREIDLPEMRFFSVTLLLQRETGGHLAETLDNLSNLLRERNLLKKKVTATTAEVRVSSAIIASIPFLFAIYLYATNKEGFFFFFENPTGQTMLQYMAASLFLGILCLRWLMKSVR